MKNLITAAFFAIAGVLSVLADGPPAGVIVYTETTEGVELLLADHVPPSDRGWAAFGGSHEEGERPADTAARETEEETHGYFKRADTLRIIEHEQPVYDGTFAFYFMKVDRVPIADIVATPIPFLNPSYTERGPYAWIPYAEIERLLDLPESSTHLQIDNRYLPPGPHTDWVWPVWLHNLRAAIATNALPWASIQIEHAVAPKP